MALSLAVAGLTALTASPAQAVTTTATGHIASASAGKCLEDAGGSTANGTAVVLDDCAGSAAQNVQIQDDGTVLVNGECLAAAGGGTTDGTALVVAACDGSTGQQWEQDGAELRNPASGRCLDDPNAATADGTAQVLWDCNATGTAEKWAFPEPGGDLSLSVGVPDLDPAVLQTFVNGINSQYGTAPLSTDIKNYGATYEKYFVPAGAVDPVAGWPGFTGGSMTVASTGSGATATSDLTADIPAADVQANAEVPGWTADTVAGTVATLTGFAAGALCTLAFAPGSPAALTDCGPVFAFVQGFSWSVLDAALVNGDLGSGDDWAKIIGAGLIAATGATGATAVGGFLGWASADLAGILTTSGQSAGGGLAGAAKWFGMLPSRAQTLSTGIGAFVGQTGAGAWKSLAQAFQQAYGRAPQVGIPLRPLAFGDSITYGVQSSTGSSYRCDLENDLSTVGDSYQFTGALEAGSGCAQFANEGLSGWTISQLAGIEHCTVTAFQPNVVLLDIGTNDINRGGAPATAAAALENLVDSILADDPTTTVLVSALIPTPDPTVAANMAAFNTQVSAWVTQQQGAGERIGWVDQGAVRLSDLADGLHPNDTGYAKMAVDWNQAIAAADIGHHWFQPAPSANGAVCGQPLWGDRGEVAGAWDAGATSDQPGAKPLPAGAHVQFADLDGDGRADYLQINADGSVDAWLNEGWSASGSIAWKPLGEIAGAAEGVGHGDPGSRIQFADLTGDGRADYLDVNPVTGEVDMWQNNGPGASGHYSWTSLPGIATGVGAPSTSRVQFADLNGDGKADYLVVNSNGSVQEWQNGGNSGNGWIWQPQGSVATGVGDPGSRIQFADLTGDGRADYLDVNPANGSVQAWLNAGTGPSGVTWNQAGTVAYGVGSPGTDIEFAPVTATGRADYLDVDPADGTVQAWKNNGPANGGWWWLPQGAAVDGVASQIQFGNLYGTGRADYLKVNSDGSVQAWANTGVPSGAPSWSGPTTVATGVGAPGSDIVLASVFGTGRADYLAVDPANGAVTAWMNGGPDGKGGIVWIPKGEIATGAAPGSEVRFADVWGSGRADYLILDPATGAITDYINAGTDSSGNIVWIPYGQIATGVGAPGSQIRLAPLYGSARADYLVVNPDTSVQAWKNGGGTAQGGWSWSQQGTVASGVGPANRVEFADLWGGGLAAYLVVGSDGSVAAWVTSGFA
ncbi:GDSL-type esterase/lipase family protein [Kitasatospora sp. NBC_01302]|uniref:GDSL-type esterase/lipase family protein n=1 Tax=Kitasatospora sp. NBC_01302 TaxID=2903575 RepID=UPI002E0FB5E0|nr:FG-GAP-like repeat-containing protein [Kitasatospora sp. NBC_01302]